ncbi:MAG: type II toxin-antitoxin system Phd/YefM family antitoxin, partial [Athalassotoga sp.]
MFSSKEVRQKWRTLLDDIYTGDDVVVERNGKPVAVVIPYKDYAEIKTILEDKRVEKHANDVYEEWKRNPDTA